MHRHADEFRAAFRGRVVHASSPQGRFAEGAVTIYGGRLVETEAYGKHLFLRFEARRVVRVHLGRQGLWLRFDAVAERRRRRGPIGDRPDDPLPRTASPAR